MKLINADELVEILDEEYRKDKSNVWKYLLINLVKQLLSDAPAIDAEPIRHGHWEDRSEDIDGIYEYCSVCHTDVDITYYGKSYTYCPYCGARMMDEVTE